MSLEEEKEISKKNCKNDIIHLNLMVHINKSLKEELSKTVSELLKQGWKQGYVGKILGIDQPKVSLIKCNSPTINFSDTMLIKFLRILGVCTIIDTGQVYISDTIKFYTREDYSNVLYKSTLEIKRMDKYKELLKIHASKKHASKNKIKKKYLQN